MVKKISIINSKSKKQKKITGGVIILGSLFWEDENNCLKGDEKKGKNRREWREQNLKIEPSIISLPTKYGRSSSSRLCTYTMILSSTKLNSMGNGLVLPYNDDFISFNDFEKQVQELAKAEEIMKEKTKYACSWGAVSLWINPLIKKDNKLILKNHWKKIGIPKYGYIKAMDYEWTQSRLLNDDFTLGNKIEINTNLDFLLCTFMQPKHKNLIQNGNKNLPNENEIANEMLTSGYQTYFCQNRANGIVTSEDNEIIKYLTKNI